MNRASNRRPRRFLHAALALTACAALASADARADPIRAWSFRVFLDDNLIGHDHFTLTDEGGERRLQNETRFIVKILFVTAYKFSHDSTERWAGNCLAGIAAHTDDGGKLFDLKGTSDGAHLILKGTKNIALGGCVMNYAYWNPEILKQQRLLNDQTGEYESVTISALGAANVSVRGASVQARHYRITGIKYPVDLWYSEDKALLALDFAVDGGRTLHYRLE